MKAAIFTEEEAEKWATGHCSMSLKGNWTIHHNLLIWSSEYLWIGYMRMEDHENLEEVLESLSRKVEISSFEDLTSQQSANFKLIENVCSAIHLLCSCVYPVVIKDLKSRQDVEERLFLTESRYGKPKSFPWSSLVDETEE